MEKRKTTAAIVYNHETGLFLGVSRKNNHNSFSFGGGKCDGEETTIQCAVRELEEETGLKAKSMNLIDVTEHINRDSDPPRLDECWTYAIRSYEGELLSNEELLSRGEGILKWVTAEELGEGAFGELCTHLVEVYYRYIGKRNDR